MFDLDPNQIEVHLAKYTVLQMELTLVEFEFNVEALFDSYLHLDGSILIWFLTLVRNDKLFLFCYAIVVTVDYDVDVVT